MKITLAIHTRHDANMSISRDEKVVSYIEFEKIVNKRYFAFSEEVDAFRRQCVEFILPCVKDFPIIDEIILNWVTPQQEEILHGIFKNVLVWKKAHHHIAHAWSSYVFTEPQESDLILSYDGGGDLDDFFKMYIYKNRDVTILKEVKVNLGRPYRLLGLLSPELYKDQKGGYSLEHALAGKIMALASLGNVVDTYEEPLNRFYRDFENHTVEGNFSIFLKNIGYADKKFLSLEIARDVLATSQRVFEEIVEIEFFPLIRELSPKRIIINGGCALNVTMNSKISRIFNIPIFISPCPSDCGISLGTLKMFDQKIDTLSSPFTDIFPKNIDMISSLKNKFNCEKFNIKKFAELLASGKIVGTVRGGLEIGPRALGNRSYLANPLINGMKNRINDMKGREFWRPVAPIVLEDLSSKYFNTNQNSPYMSFAPNVRLQYKSDLKEILHFDDTARIQTVRKTDGWIYELLHEFEKLTGWGIIMNTSFNKKGEPLINNMEDVINIFDSTKLDGIATNDLLILK